MSMIADQLAKEAVSTAVTKDTLVPTTALAADGSTIELGHLERSQTVHEVKKLLAAKTGIGVGSQQLFVMDDERHDEDLSLKNHETIHEVMSYAQMVADLPLALMVGGMTAEDFVPSMPTTPELTIGTGTRGSGDGEFNQPWGGMAFIPGRRGWLVTTDKVNDRVKIHDTNTSEARSGWGALICEFGKHGSGEGEMMGPMDVVVTDDSSFVIVVEQMNHRMQMLRLNIKDDSASLEFVRFIGARGSQDGEMVEPVGAALRTDKGGVQTLLVSHIRGHRVQEFALDGTFLRVFAGEGTNQLNYPWSLAVLPNGQVAVLEEGIHCIQLFDETGEFLRKFGSNGKDVDGKFNFPCGLTCDANGSLLVTDYGSSRLQVFNSEGEHLCTRDNIGLTKDSFGKIVWDAEGGLAISDAESHCICVWKIE
jgi:hypothetical protein